MERAMQAGRTSEAGGVQVRDEASAYSVPPGQGGGNRNGEEVVNMDDAYDTFRRDTS